MARVLFLLFALTWSSHLFPIPPRCIPPEYYQEFTMDGMVPVESSYYNNSYLPDKPIVYGFETLEALKQKAIARETNYYYKTDLYLYSALDRYISHIAGKKVAIMGSNNPWYEAIVLAYGGYPVTIEYNTIISEHPNLRTMTVKEFEENPETFDAILSISSYEHDGLGRYGDPICPTGDLKAMEKTKKMLLPGGLLFLAVPIGMDRLVWNAHRVYGEKRLPLLLSGWKVLDTFGFAQDNLYRQDSDPHQPIFVLTLKEQNP